MNDLYSYIPARVLTAALIVSLVALSSAATLIGCGSGEGSTTAENGDDGDDDVEITITAPEEGSYHDRSRVTVEGTAEGTSEVEVNGDTVSVQDGEWDTFITFDDGEVTATASAEQTEASVDFVVDTQHPEILIDSPDRGTVIEDVDGDGQGSVVIEGEVVNAGPSGMSLFQVNGTTLDIDDGERFEEEIELREGLNILSVQAIDRAHNDTTKHRAVIFGPLADPDAPIEEAGRADIHHTSGTDALTAVIESYVTPAQLEEFLGDDLELEEGISVEVHELTWDDLEVDLEPRDGELALELVISDLFVAGAFSFSGGEPIDGDISIGEVIVELDIELAADDDNQLHVDIIDDDLDLTDITVNIDGEQSDEAAILVAGAIGFAFNEFLEELIVENLYDPDILTQEFEFLDRTIVITLLLEDIDIGPGGIIARIGVEFPGDKMGVVPDVPGALNREVQGSPSGAISRPIVFHSHRTALERIVHALWQSGLFHQSIGEDEGIDLPFDLNAGGLATLLDSRIRDIHESDTPVELRLRPLLPPVVELRDKQEARIEAGDFLIDFVLRPDDGSETLFLTLAFQFQVDVEFEIGSDDVDLDLDIQVKTDIDDQPIFDFDPDDTTGLIDLLLELVPDLIMSDLDIEPETTLEWASIGNPAAEFVEDYISIGIDLEPAEDFIDDDEVEPEDD